MIGRKRYTGKREQKDTWKNRRKKKKNKPIVYRQKAQIHKVGLSVACVSFQMRLIRTVDDADAGRARKSAHQRYRQREIHYF